MFLLLKELFACIDTTSECDIQPNVGCRDLDFLFNGDTIHPNNACGEAVSSLAGIGVNNVTAVGPWQGFVDGIYVQRYQLNLSLNTSVIYKECHYTCAKDKQCVMSK